MDAIDRNISIVRGVVRGRRDPCCSTLRYELALDRRTGALVPERTRLMLPGGAVGGLGHSQLFGERGTEVRVWQDGGGTWRLTVSAGPVFVRGRLELLAREGLHAPPQNVWQWRHLTGRAKGAGLLASLLGGLWMSGRAA